jgi:hypothetical protein
MGSQLSYLDHPFHVPTSSRARLSAPTIIQRLRPKDFNPAPAGRAIGLLGPVAASLAEPARTVTTLAAPRTLATAATRSPEALVILERGVGAQPEPGYYRKDNERWPPRALDPAEDHSAGDQAEFRGLEQVKTSARVSRAKPRWRRAGRDAKESMEGSGPRSTGHGLASAA